MNLSNVAAAAQKSKITAFLLVAALVILPLGSLLMVGATVGGVISGAASTLSTLPVNCKAPPNIFKAWDTFEDFMTGVDCNQCPVAEAGAGGSGENGAAANRAEYVQTIIGTGNAMNVPEKGIVIALATTLVESGLKNYANDGAYDVLRNAADNTLGSSAKAAPILGFVKRSMSFPHDAVGSDATSVGLFQQQAWWGTMGASTWESDPEGTIKRLMDPTFQAQKFFNKLVAVPGWQDMSHGVAAQTVQVSAVPHAYALRVAEAQALYNKHKGAAKTVQLYDFGAKFEGDPSKTGNSSEAGSCSSTATSTGIVLAKSALYQVTAPWSEARGADLYGAHAGMDIDCGNDYEDVFTPVSGVVTIAVNGNPSGSGMPAGDVQVKTEEGTVVRMHHVRNVFVKAGDQVKGGQAVAECANTGMSFGTHLHLETIVSTSTNPKIKNLPVSPLIPEPRSSSLRDPALVLDILGVNICPPYVANRQTVAVGAPLPSGPMKCWPPEEWTK